MDISALKDFVDLGSTALIALIMLWYAGKWMGGIDDKLVKILTLLTVLVKTNTNFNHIDKILGKTGEDVAQSIIEAESKSS